MIDFKDELNNCFNKQIIAPKYLLDKLCLLNENDRNSPQYNDPLYFPFYYYLGKFVKSENVCQIGVDLGLSLCCYLQSSNNVKKIFAFQPYEDDLYSFRIANSNIKKINKKINVEFYAGGILDEEFQDKFSNKWDIIFLKYAFKKENLREILDLCWLNLKIDGYLIIDNLCEKAIKEYFYNFCKIQNREFFEFKTRYGSAIIKK